MSLTRGCGSRIAGACYAECTTSPYGRPIEDFLLDPPQLLDADLGVSPIGVTLLDRSGITHIADWIGSEHYTNVCDWIEETRRFGMSRRLPKTLDFSRLTEMSRHLVIHARAWIWSAPSYPLPHWSCIKARDEHASYPLPQGMCGVYWWHDIEGGKPPASAMTILPDEIEREMPSFTYRGFARPIDTPGLYAPAFFAAMPITRIVVVSGPGAAETLMAARRACLPVEEVPE